MDALSALFPPTGGNSPSSTAVHHALCALVASQAEGASEAARGWSEYGSVFLSAEVQDLIKDSGETIDFPDFCSMMAKKGVNTEEELVDAFRVFDKEGDGHISTAEARQIMCNVGEHLPEDELDEMIREIDPDGEGRVDYVKFTKIMLSNKGRWVKRQTP